VADTGVGLPEGFDLHTTRTLGLRLVNTLVKQLQGEVAVRASRGTEFSVRFKEIARPRTSSFSSERDMPRTGYQRS